MFEGSSNGELCHWRPIVCLPGHLVSYSRVLVFHLDERTGDKCLNKVFSLLKMAHLLCVEVMCELKNICCHFSSFISSIPYTLLLLTTSAAKVPFEIFQSLILNGEAAGRINNTRTGFFWGGGRSDQTF